MSNIFLINVLYVFLFICQGLLAQEVEIKSLSKNINKSGSEFNFIQLDEKKSYYSSATLEETEYQSGIYKTELKNGKWQKGKYFDLANFYNIANIQLPKKFNYYCFTASEKGNQQKIYLLDIDTQKLRKVNNIINLENTINTQPHITYHSNQNVMYFVSDRKGGFGGLDIWLSIIDENGNFGVPINAGPKVNSENDEITPFYNLWKNEIYFSSNKNKERGFDIYKSKGKLNLWESSTPITELNTEHNELYLNFFKENEGFLASNRQGINECNDIFSFRYKSSNKTRYHTLNAIKYLPLCLYFHNDEPDCCTMKTTTEKTYQDTYVSYFKMEEEYFKISKDEKVASFFSDSLRENYNKLNLILREILTELIEGKKIQIEVKGYASPLYETQYNINLSKRRIKSFENFICFYNSRIFVDYLESGALQIIITPFGESKSSEKTSSDPKNKEESIYGINAMLERKIEITNIIFQ